MLDFIGQFIIQVATTFLALLLYHNFKHWLKSHGQISEMRLESAPKTIESLSNQNDDLDLIAQVRAASTSTVPNQNSNAHLITELSGVAESSGDHSFEQMASHLISVTRNIAGALDDSTSFSPEKKSEIAALLKAAPDLIAKIAEMDSEALGALLNSSNPGKDESRILMEIFDQLK